MDVNAGRIETSIPAECGRNMTMVLADPFSDPTPLLTFLLTVRLGKSGALLKACGLTRED
jgi:hypothetical protein